MKEESHPENQVINKRESHNSQDDDKSLQETGTPSTTLQEVDRPTLRIPLLMSFLLERHANASHQPYMT